MLYLLHSTVPLTRGNGQEVRHYLGWCGEERLLTRLQEHRSGHSKAKIIRAYLRAGGSLVLVKTWPGAGHALEAYLKKNGHVQDLCPLCNAQSKERRNARRRKASAHKSEPLPPPSEKRSTGTGGALPAPKWTHRTTDAGVSRRGRSPASSTPSGDEWLDQVIGGQPSTVAVPPSSQVDISSAGTKQRSTSTN